MAAEAVEVHFREKPDRRCCSYVEASGKLARGLFLGVAGMQAETSGEKEAFFSLLLWDAFERDAFVLLLANANKLGHKQVTVSIFPGPFA